MKKIYEKNPVWFAVLWILLYVLGTGFADSASRSMGTEKLLTLPVHLILTAVLWVWIRKNGLSGHFGLCRGWYKAGRLLWYIPLVLIPCVNLRNGLHLNLSPVESVLYAGSMLLVGFLEEVIFRGLLFKALRPGSVRRAVIISAVTFGMGHLVNLFSGNGNSTAETLLQVCYAVALGFLFVILFERGGSLWPAIACHSAIDVLSAFAGEDASEGRHVLFCVLLILISLGYTVFLLKALPPRKE